MTWSLTSDPSAVEQDRVGLCEEAAGKSLEEHPREAAGSGSSGARGRCWYQEVSVSITEEKRSEVLTYPASNGSFIL